ncbi:MAG TPA: peptidase [bacterium]|nr:peptidase [bacterium]HPN42440.1 peptidase [bacterium]
MRLTFVFGGILIAVLALCSCSPKEADTTSVAYVNEQLEKLAPVELQCDLGSLSVNDKKALAKLVQAGEIIDRLFLLQVTPDNPQLLEQLQNDAKAQAHLDLFKVMFGPWNRLEEHTPFIKVGEKPLGAGFYPTNMSKEEFLAAFAGKPDVEKQFTSEFTIISRDSAGLQVIPYHVAYKELVEKVSALLDEAAALTDDATLKNYLTLRAQAFLTDDYYESDMAWMDLAGDLEIVIGPYEVYEDRLFNYKAAYEAFLCVVDHEESRKLEIVSGYLDDMENNLPIPDQYKNFNRGSSSPVKVVQEVFSAGDTKAGIQTTAFNLPNDERVREAKGSKKVMLKNVARAKFEKCWIPIVNTILADDPLKHVTFDAYFNHVLLHEVSHGLGPGNITLENGVKTSVGKELKEHYSTIEECKADVLGLYNMLFLMSKGVFPQEMEESTLASYLGGMFRSIRFGIDEAHGGGVAIQFNYFIETGAFYADANGKLNYDRDKLLNAVKRLANTLLLIEARGDYTGAGQLVEKYRVMTPLMAKLIDELKHVPVDIRPVYPVINELSEIE